MIRYFVLFFMLLLIPLSFSSVYGTVENFTTDQSLYHTNDNLTISGTVSYDPDVPFVTIQIFTPGKSNFAYFWTLPVNSDGSFSHSLIVGGPTWTSDGTYPIKITYGGSLEHSIEYVELSPTPEPQSTPEPEPQSTPEPILEIPASFVDVTKDSQYYVDRYNNEPSYKEWFDANYPQYTSIYEAVGLGEPKELASFVDVTKDPQYYVDRYNNEPSYKEWFDANYPQYTSIYEAVGLDEPASVPEWIRSNAGWWYTGAITDSTFVDGIEYMLENNIIVISNIPSSGTVSDDVIPEWIRNNAHWWSQDLISEDEFVNSLKFLIQEGIIIIN